MSRRRKEPFRSKADWIRLTKQQHPDWGPKQIIESLAAEGIQVESSQVSTTLSNDRRRASGHLANGNGQVHEKSDAGIPDDAFNKLVITKRFATELGGIEQAKTCIDRLQQLQA